MKNEKTRQILHILFLMMILFSKNAFGYIDPGTGSYLIQILLAGFLGAAFAIKIFWNKIKGFLSKLFNKGKNE